MNDKKVYIIGAGVAGLVAAYELEAVGYRPVILEASTSVGGRIKTDIKDGYLLDRGFQILLTAYPEAQRYLNYESLNLKYFDGDVVILRTDGVLHATDPIKNPSGILSMAFSKVGNMKDKIKLLQMTASLMTKSDEKIFAQPFLSTTDYFVQRGFSPEIRFNFLNPLYRGIFLEEELSTSSNMFEYVFKMMSKGKAAVPEMGMQEIPNQLFSKLKNTEIRFNTRVNKVEGNTISIENQDSITADEIICASNPTYLNNDITATYDKYHKVVNMYFALRRSFIAQPIMGLVPGENFLINNLHFPSDISPATSTTGKALLSVTILREVEINDDLPSQIAEELQAITGINAEFFEHIHTYVIDKALPIVAVPQNDTQNNGYQVNDNIHLAGDHMVNPSLNGAMVSGRRAAESIIFKHTIAVTEHLEPLQTTKIEN